MIKYDVLDEKIKIPVDSILLNGILSIPSNSIGVVIFVHGSGSGRFSPRNVFVARALQEKKIATLLFDLLTEEEDYIYDNRFDIDLLAARLDAVTMWAKKEALTKKMEIGYFGASTGAAAAIKSAVSGAKEISALVSRGGRVDLSAAEAPDLRTPTMLIVGGNDLKVLEINEIFFDKIKANKKLTVIPNATHLFEEKGALEEVARSAGEWFIKYFTL